MGTSERSGSPGGDHPIVFVIPMLCFAAEGYFAHDHWRPPRPSHSGKRLDLFAPGNRSLARCRPAYASRIKGGARLKQTFILRSALHSTIMQYLELNFALGHRYKNTITALKSLDRFLHGLPRVSKDLNAELFHSWCQSQSQIRACRRRYRMLSIRRFCLYA